MANRVDENRGFYREDNAATILNKNNEQINIAKTSKSKLARQIIEYIGKQLAKWKNESSSN